MTQEWALAAGLTRLSRLARTAALAGVVACALAASGALPAGAQDPAAVPGLPPDAALALVDGVMRDFDSDAAGILARMSSAPGTRWDGDVSPPVLPVAPDTPVNDPHALRIRFAYETGGGLAPSVAGRMVDCTRLGRPSIEVIAAAGALPPSAAFAVEDGVEAFFLSNLVQRFQDRAPPGAVAVMVCSLTVALSAPATAEDMRALAAVDFASPGQVLEGRTAELSGGLARDGVLLNDLLVTVNRTEGDQTFLVVEAASFLLPPES